MKKRLKDAFLKGQRTLAHVAEQKFNIKDQVVLQNPQTKEWD